MIGGVHMITEPYNAAMLDLRRMSDRSCMWALREAGRQTKRAARQNVRVRSGALRDSIGAGKLKTVSPRNYRITVGPRGGRTFAYAAKIEALDHYTQQAYDQVAPKFKDIQEAAMRRVVAKYGIL